MMKKNVKMLLAVMMMLLKFVMVALMMMVRMLFDDYIFCIEVAWILFS